MKNIFRNFIIFIFFSIGIYSSINFIIRTNNNNSILKIKTEYFYFYFRSHPLKGKKIKYKLNIRKKDTITIKNR